MRVARSALRACTNGQSEQKQWEYGSSHQHCMRAVQLSEDGTVAPCLLVTARTLHDPMPLSSSTVHQARRVRRIDNTDRLGGERGEIHAKGWRAACGASA